MVELLRSIDCVQETGVSVDETQENITLSSDYSWESALDLLEVPVIRGGDSSRSDYRGFIIEVSCLANLFFVARVVFSPISGGEH